VTALAEQLQTELDRRRARNPRYSLRAFAQQLGVDHSTLSQWMRGRRTLSRASERRLRAALDERRHDALLDLTRRPDFVGDSRWIAGALGWPIDEVNCALQTLIRTNRLEMSARAGWIATERCG
jgi:transcriptional regulator with XRE-family HTH domain